MFTVKVANFPGEVKEALVAPGTTIRGAFEAAGITPNGSSITRNGLAATLDDQVADGDRLISAQGAKGN